MGKHVSVVWRSGAGVGTSVSMGRVMGLVCGEICVRGVRQ